MRRASAIVMFWQSFGVPDTRGQDRYMRVRAKRNCIAGPARALGLSAALAIALSGCEVLQQIFPPEPPPPVTASEPPAEETPAVTKTAPPPTAKPRPPAAATPARPKPAVDHRVLIGQGEEDVTRMLGEPREVRNDPPAMVWSYGAGECKLDVFFYLDLKSQDFRALAYNFDPNATSDTSKNVCLEKIQEANRDSRR